MVWNKTKNGNKIYKNEIKGFEIRVYTVNDGFVLKVNRKHITSESAENIDNLISEVESIIEIINLDLDVIEVLKSKFAKRHPIPQMESNDELIKISFNSTNDERKIIVQISDEGERGYVASRVETEQSAITIAQELLDEYNEKGYYIRRHISGNNRLPHEKMNDEINIMNAGSVDDLFNQAWVEYKNLKHEIKIFVEENNLNYDIFKVEMAGPHVKIKHSLPDILWTEELHDKFCEAFGVHLQYFKRTLSKGQRKKPPLGGFHWVYGSTVHDEKFIVPYDELPLEG